MALLGTVKSFDDTKGYGFITPDESGEEIFVHFKALQIPGFQTLVPGQKVLFEVVTGSKGKQCSNVRLADSN